MRAARGADCCRTLSDLASTLTMREEQSAARVDVSVTGPFRVVPSPAADDA